MHPGDQEILISKEAIQEKIAELALQVSRDYAGKNPLLVCVLKGAVIFLADFMRSLDIPAEIDFMAVSSYGASTKSSGVVRILKDLETSIEGRHIIIVEDIIDTGLTLKYLAEYIGSRGPASLKIVTLLDKPDRRKVAIEADYCGFKIPDRFVVGYGLDFDEQYRHLPDVCVLKGSDQ
jgi:hypoxanthine phosphoribosyltransferase